MVTGKSHSADEKLFEGLGAQTRQRFLGILQKAFLGKQSTSGPHQEKTRGTAALKKTI